MTDSVTILQYTIPERKFKSLGYKFSKHGASSYKSYRLNDPKYKTITLLWAFVAGKELELPDFTYRTFDVIQQYKKQVKQGDMINDDSFNQHMAEDICKLTYVKPTTPDYRVKFYINKRTCRIVTDSELQKEIDEFVDSCPKSFKKSQMKQIYGIEKQYKGRGWKTFNESCNTFDKLLQQIDKLKPTTTVKNNFFND